MFVCKAQTVKVASCCSVASACCSGICESGSCLTPRNLACGKPGMKCRASSDCCGVNSMSIKSAGTNFKHCVSTEVSGNEKGGKVNWGLCKSDADCKPNDRCNSNNGVCKSPGEKGLVTQTANLRMTRERHQKRTPKKRARPLQVDLAKKANRHHMEKVHPLQSTDVLASPSPANHANVDLSPSPSSGKSPKKSPSSSNTKKGKNRRRTSATSETNTNNVTIASLNSSTQCLVQYTVSSTCKNRMWNVDGHVVKCKNGQEPLSGSGSILLDISTGKDTSLSTTM